MESCSRPQVHASAYTKAGIAALRDLEPQDVDAIVRFSISWSRIDLCLRTVEDPLQRFCLAIRKDIPDFFKSPPNCPNKWHACFVIRSRT